MSRSKYYRAPEFDDHTRLSRPPGVLRRAIEPVLHSTVEVATLIQNPEKIARNWKIKPNYQ